jgi:hypothetical protein
MLEKKRYVDVLAKAWTEDFFWGTELLEHIFVGALCEEVYVNAEKNLLKFVLDSGEVFAEIEAGCCSTSWVEHMEGVNNLLGRKILSLEELDFPPNALSDYKVEKKYGLRLVTDIGDFIMDYRNQSNGWYGASVKLHSEHLEDDWRQVLSDF